jgi:hypothetical protein
MARSYTGLICPAAHWNPAAFWSILAPSPPPDRPFSR